MGGESDTQASGTVMGGLNSLAASSAQMTGAVSQVATGAQQLNAGAAELRSSVAELASGSQQSASGASALAAGLGSASDVYNPATGQGATLAGALATLSGQGSQLVDGAAGVSDGAAALTQGAGQVSAGSTSLAQGLAQLTAGTDSLATGAGSARDGAVQLAQGSSSLAEGTGSLKDGVDQLGSGSSSLADGLRTAVDAVPSYSEEEASALASSLAQPVSVDETQVGRTSPKSSSMPAAMSLALWVGALVIVSGLGLLSRRRVEASMSSARLAIASLRPALGLAVAQALLLVAVVALAGADLGGGTDELAQVVGLVVVGAVSMTVLHAALVAALGTRGGTGASVLLLVAQAVCVVGASVPQALTGVFAGAAGFLPVPVLASALRSVVLGAAGVSLGSGIVILLVWGCASALVMTLAVRRRRATSLEALRREALVV